MCFVSIELRNLKREIKNKIEYALLIWEEINSESRKFLAMSSPIYIEIGK